MGEGAGEEIVVVERGGGGGQGWGGRCKVAMWINEGDCGKACCRVRVRIYRGDSDELWV
jgi:hypothetical protein